MGPLILHEDFPDGSLDLELGPVPHDFFHEDLPKRQKSSPKKSNNSAVHHLTFARSVVIKKK